MKTKVLCKVSLNYKGIYSPDNSSDMAKLSSQKGDIARFSFGKGDILLSGNYYSVSESIGPVNLQKYGIEATVEKGITSIIIPLSEADHIIGLGEKALPVERKRTRVEMWNYDNYNYSLGRDPLYSSIPFFMKYNMGKVEGFFINYPGRVIIDSGVKDYNNIVITIESENFDFYIFGGNSFDEILQKYSSITGMPFQLPEWALEHQISKYSYYPQERVEEVVDNYLHAFGPTSVGAVYLDIDYMDEYRIFTADQTRFHHMKEMVENLSKKGVKVIPIIDPGVKADQNFSIFRKLLGSYVETSNGDLFTGDVWPGKCVFPDFLNPEAEESWKSLVSTFMKDGYGGIWLDMNEPSIHNTPNRTISEDAVHHIEGKKVSHKDVHNMYALAEARATFNGIPGDDKFILTRSAYAGIQKYAAIWSGDGSSDFENVGLQIPLLTSLSVSGVPYVGCDLGGFLGYSTPELVLRFYQMALFFPIYRNHKVKEGNDQELYIFDDYYRERFKEILSMRHNLVPHMLWKARESERSASPIIRPLAYNFPDENGIFTVNDQYMLGEELLLAPVLKSGMKSRELYLPTGKWYEFQSGKIYEGHRRIESEGDIPLFMMENSVALISNSIYLFGKVDREIFYNGKWVNLKYNGKEAFLGSKKLSENEYIDVFASKPSLKDLCK